MDMYYYLKELLSCEDCGFPLSYSHDTGYNSYVAVCFICEKEYEIDVEIKLKRSK